MPRHRMDKRRAGKLPLAAMAKARPTMKATFWPLKAMPKPMATRPSTRVARLAIFTSSSSVVFPDLNTFTYRSCEKVAAPARVSPATTARMVAKATAAMKPRNMVPPVTSARSRADMLPPLSNLVITSWPTSTMAPKPMMKGQDVEVGDEARGVEHALPGLFGVGHGVEAHEDVGQPGRAEHKRYP